MIRSLTADDQIRRESVSLRLTRAKKDGGGGVTTIASRQISTSASGTLYATEFVCCFCVHSWCARRLDALSPKRGYDVMEPLQMRVASLARGRSVAVVQCSSCRSREEGGLDATRRNETDINDIDSETATCGNYNSRLAPSAV